MPFEALEMRKFSEAGRAISQAAGVGFEEWARGEMAAVLKIWAGRTEVIPEGQAIVEARYKAGKRAFGYTNIKQNPFGITVNTGRRGGFPGEVWYRHPKSKKFQQAGQIQNDSTFVPAWIHWKGPVWEAIQQGGEKYAAELARLKPAALRAIGLARQSVVQIADSLGIALESVKGGGISADGIAKARMAIASSGTRYQNGLGQIEKSQSAFFIEAINRYPYNMKLGMDSALAGILQSRLSLHQRNIEQGVLKSMKSVARAYPYLNVG